MLKIIDKNTLPVSEPEILRLLGILSRDPVQNRLRSMIREEIRHGMNLIVPQGIWETAILGEDERKGILTLNDTIPIHSQDVKRHLTGFTRSVLLAVTIGSTLEEEVDRLFKQREYTRAAILDAVGSRLAEEAIDLLTEMYREDVGLISNVMSRRFSPGYGDWDIRVQPELLQFLNAAAIGLSCNEAFILIPRKSITAIAGF